MTMKSIFEEAIKKLELERDRKAAEVKEKVTRESIVPFNAEIDRAREKAIAELQSSLNSSIASLQAQFAEQKSSIIAAGEKKKSDNASAVITSATYSVTIEYDKAISALRKQMEEINE